MALVTFPSIAERKIVRLETFEYYPGRTEVVTLTGAKNVINRASGRLAGTLVIGQAKYDKALDIETMLTRLANGINHTVIPFYEGGQRGSYRTFNADGLVDTVTVTAVSGDDVTLSRALPRMRDGCYVAINERMHRIVDWTPPVVDDRTGVQQTPPSATLWPEGVAVAVGAVLKRATDIRAYLRIGAAPSRQTITGSWSGPWELDWEEYVP